MAWVQLLSVRQWLCWATRADLVDAGASTAAPPVERVAAPVSATVLAHKGGGRLAEVLDALAWCDEIVLLDTGSAEDSEDIAAIASRRPKVSLHRLAQPFPGFGEAHRRATALARHDWVLSIDSDEVVSPELAAELRALELCPDTVYALPFHNYFNGRLVTTCGWYPDRHERLFNRKVTDFCASEVHEKVQTGGLKVQRLRHPVLHYSYESADDFLRKMRAYSQLFAAQHAGRKSSSLMKAVGRSAWAFFKSYVLQRGFTEGHEGFLISTYKAHTTFWKYVLLQDANRRS